MSRLLRRRRLIRKHPERIIKPYIKKVRGKLIGIDPTKAWRFVDYSLRLRRDFGKMAGMWRIHHNLSEVLEVSLAGESKITSAMLIQLQKCIHQAALDEGAWDKAELYLESENPLGPVQFPGEACETEGIHSYTKAVRELRRYSRKTSGSSSGSEEALPDKKEKKKKKKRQQREAADRQQREPAVARPKAEAGTG